MFSRNFNTIRPEEQKHMNEEERLHGHKRCHVPTKGPHLKILLLLILSYNKNTILLSENKNNNKSENCK